MTEVHLTSILETKQENTGNLGHAFYTSLLVKFHWDIVSTLRRECCGESIKNTQKILIIMATEIIDLGRETGGVFILLSLSFSRCVPTSRYVI